MKNIFLMMSLIFAGIVVAEAPIDSDKAASTFVPIQPERPAIKDCTPNIFISTGLFNGSTWTQKLKEFLTNGAKGQLKKLRLR